MKHRKYCGAHLVACMLFVGTSLPVHAQEVVGLWTVDYTTRAVAVDAVMESVAEGNLRMVTITFRNISAAPITAIAFDFVGSSDTAGADFGRGGKLLQPGDTFDFKVRRNPANRRLRVKAVLFADQRADEGDPSAARVLRFRRLASLLETNRCLAMLNRLDPSNFNTASVKALAASVNAQPTTLDEALASLPEDRHLEFGSHARLRGASADAQRAFLSELRLERHSCNEQVQKVTQEGARGLEWLRRQLQGQIETVRPLCERDMAVEVEQ